MADEVDEPVALFRELEGILKPVTSSHSLSLATMLRGWSRHVRRFVGGIHSTPINDAVIWGADDYIAALTIRSMIEETRTEVPSGLATQFDAWLDRVDAEYRDFAVPDEQGLIPRWVHDEVPDGWWWHRVPPSGPILEDLLEMQ